jgi:hypothetical protein
VGLFRVDGGCAGGLASPPNIVVWAFCSAVSQSAVLNDFETHLLHQHRQVVVVLPPVQLIPPPHLLLSRCRWHPRECCRAWGRRNTPFSRTRPLLARASLEEARALRQDQLVQQIALLLAPVVDDNLDVARVREDGELILRLIRRATKLRSMRPVPSGGGCARGMRCDRRRAAYCQRALGALRVWIGNHAPRLVTTQLLSACCCLVDSTWARAPSGAGAVSRAKGWRVEEGWREVTPPRAARRPKQRGCGLRCPHTKMQLVGWRCGRGCGR